MRPLLNGGTLGGAMGSAVPVQMPLLGEGVDVWRPVSSQLLGGELFMIDLQPIPDTEEWAFSGDDCAVDANGLPRFVEVLPADMHPGAPAQQAV